MNRFKILSIVVLLGAAWFLFPSEAPPSPHPSPSSYSGQKATAVLAGGCFWCVEHDLMQVPGVIDAVSGYSGGDRPNPTYKNYNKPDGQYKIPHVEVVEVTYDPVQLSYRELLHAFYRRIDPTDGGGQFCDRGGAYAPVVYPETDEEKTIAREVKLEVESLLKRDIQVGTEDRAPFWPAEDYHQDYSEKNPKRYKYYRWNCGRDQTVAKVWQNK